MGIWAATLIMLRHARRVQPSNSPPAPAAATFIRGPDAPEVVVFERRAQEEHCSRRNVRITLDEHTVALLNKHTKSKQFVSGMALAEIERILLEQWRQLGGPRGFEYCNHIESPADLAATGEWDLILWAGGRWSLDDATRKELNCNMRVGEAEDVLVFELRGFAPQRRGAGEPRPTRLEDLAQLAAMDLGSTACQAALSVAQEAAASCQYKVVLRFSRDGELGAGAKGKAPPLAWLWLLGLPPELKAARASAAAAKGPKDPLQSMPDALESELERLGLGGESAGDGATSASARWLAGLRAAVVALQDRLFSPSSVSVRWVNASYWSSDRIVCSVPGGDSGKNTPLVLIGDAAMGKPFYTGTTLNVHLAEVKAFSRLPVIRWGSSQDASPADERRRSTRYAVDESLAAKMPLLPYEQRYKELLLRTPAFHRR